MTVELSSVDGQVSQNGYNTCRCKRHKQHIFFRFLWNNPGVTLKAAAKELHISYDNARQLHHRLLSYPNLHKRCPECFRPNLQGLVCTNCGAELDIPNLPQGIKFEETSPVHTIQPLNGLGSVTPYQGGRDSEGNWRPLKMQYGGRNVQHLVEVTKNSLLERCKSELWERLKEVMPEDSVTEEASRLLAREVLEFQARYPPLARSGNATRALVDNVMKLMTLRYPGLRKGDNVTPHSGQDVLGGGKDE
jgi:hypothetical protein